VEDVRSGFGPMFSGQAGSRYLATLTRLQGATR